LKKQGLQSPDNVKKPSPLYAADRDFGQRRTSLNLDSDVCLRLPDKQVSSFSPQKPAPVEAENIRPKCENDLHTKYLNKTHSPSQSRQFHFQHFISHLINNDPKIRIGLYKHGEIYHTGFQVLKFKSKKF